MTEGAVGTAGPWERPAAPLLSPRFAGSLPQALCWAGTHPWPLGASPGVGAEDRHTVGLPLSTVGLG